jgi:hypothetical protein
MDHNPKKGFKQKFKLAEPKPFESGGKRCTGRLQKDTKRIYSNLAAVELEIHLAHVLELGLRYQD